MATAADTFDRPDGAPGPNWTAVGLAIRSNKLAHVGGPDTYGFARWIGTAFAADHSAEYSPGGDVLGGPAVRLTDVGNWYAYVTTGALIRSSGGVRTTLATFAPFGAAARVRLSVQGTTLRAFRDGLLVGTWTDAVLATGGPGVVMAGVANPLCDNWIGADYVAGSYRPYQARSAVCRSGVTRSENITRRLRVLVGGVDVTCHLDDSVGLTMSSFLSGGSSEAAFRIRKVEPLEGQTLIVSTGLVPIFGGTLLQRQATHLDDVAFLGWDVAAGDWRWLLDRYRPVNGIYQNAGINVIVADILKRFVDPASGFTPGEIPQSMGDVALIEFSDVLVSEALTRLAQASKTIGFNGGAFWRIRPDKAIDLAIDFADTPVVLDAATCYEALQTQRTATQLRNQVRILAGGADLLMPAPINATELVVNNGLLYPPTGGTVRVAGLTVTYTGVVNATTQTGTLVGCVGLTRDVAIGTAVQPLIVVNDLVAQADAATRLGGGQSGVIFVTRENNDLSYAEAEGAAAGELAMFSRVLLSIAYSSTQPAGREFGVGRLLDASIVLPGVDAAHPAEVIDGTFRIQEVAISTITAAALAGDDPRFRWSLTARRARRVNWYDVVAQTAQEAVR